jgi:hypothetical protein
MGELWAQTINRSPGEEIKDKTAMNRIRKHGERDAVQSQLQRLNRRLFPTKIHITQPYWHSSEHTFLALSICFNDQVL